MDHNKFSSDNLLDMEFTGTPFGSVCSKSEVKCVRCRELFSVAVPADVIKKVNKPEQTGTALVEYILETKGWAQKIVTRKSGKIALYSICPDCVEKDFKALEE